MTIETLFLASRSAAPRLRVALLFPRGATTALAARMLDRLSNCDFVDIVGVLLAPAASGKCRDRGSLMYRLYRWADSKAHPRSASIVAAAVPQHGLHRSLYAIDCNQDSTRLVASDSQQRVLASCRFDVIVSIGVLADTAVLSPFAKYGIWTCKMGDPLLGDEQSRVFWHTIRESPPIKVAIECLQHDRVRPFVLDLAHLSILTSISTVRNLVGPACLAEGMVQAKLWQLHSFGWEHLLRHVGADLPPLPRAGALPTNAAMLSWAARKSVRQARHRLHQMNTKAVWAVALRRGSTLRGLAAALSVDELTQVNAPIDKYYADPFLIARDGAVYLFVEEVDIATARGIITCMQLDESGVPGSPLVALRRPYHLSYPQVFEHQGDVFMIPETGFNNTVEIYRAVDFPTQWELVRVLFEGSAFDSTLLRHNGLFWFFVTIADVRNTQCAQLFLFYSETLLGEWTMHPAAPISSDIGVARCAGSPFMDGNNWIRPAQDGSHTYGGALRYQRITRLDTHDYQEEPAGVLTPDAIPGSAGMHTYNRQGNVEAIDCKFRITLPKHLRANTLRTSR